MFGRMYYVVICSILAMVLAGCGGSAAPAAAVGSAGSSTSAAQTAAALPACAYAGAAIPMPEGFPAAFPLPSGTVINHQEARSGGRIIIGGVVPLDVKEIAIFLERELPQAGFTPSLGESEPGEAESAFEGNGIRGRWKANSIDGCPNTSTLGIVVGQ